MTFSVIGGFGGLMRTTWEKVGFDEQIKRIRKYFTPNILFNIFISVNIFILSAPGKNFSFMIFFNSGIRCVLVLREFLNAFFQLFGGPLNLLICPRSSAMFCTKL